jgi:hypothetical protein
MIVQASGLWIGVGRFSRPRREVGVITMADPGLETNRHVEVPPDAGVLRLLVPGVAVGVFVDSRRVVDEVDLTR